MFQIKKRIQDRIFVRIGSLYLLFIILLILISFFIFKDYSIENAFHISRMAVQESNHKIDRMFEEIESIAHSLAGIELVKISDYDKMDSLFFSLAKERNKYIRSIYYSNLKGRFIQKGYDPKSFDVHGNPLSLPKDYDPRIRPWFVRALKQNKYTITEPYFFTSGLLGITASIPIINNKQLSGVLGIDITLQMLQDNISNLDFYQGSYCMMINLEGKVVVGKSLESNSKLEFYQSMRELEKLQTRLPDYELKEKNRILSEEKGEFFTVINQKNMLVAFATNHSLNWKVLVAIPEEIVMKNSSRMLRILLVFTILVITGLGFLLNFQLKRLINPLNQLTLSASQIKEKNFCQCIPIEKYNKDNEIGKLETTFNEMAKMIQTYSKEMENIIDNKTAQIQKTKITLEKMNLKMKNDLMMAKEIQNAIFSQTFSHIHELKPHVFYRPMDEVGGDFYDILPISKDKLGILIADVSGHGLPSAFITAMIKISFINHSKEDLSPDQTIQKVHKEFVRVLGNLGYYFTVFYGIIHLDTMTLNFTNAGHRGAYLLKSNQELEPLKTHSSFVGIFEKAEFETQTKSVGKGDKLILFTDGIVDARNDSHEMFGIKRLESLIENNRTSLSQEIVIKLENELKLFMANHPQNDDQTFMIIDVI